ncbi:riboflavin synthase [Psychrobacillus vulpis]|uniref:Riboflavin synthase n=1 Tax=Psychrobacillus vulpis TaxID=2325572 RepID=A0A544TTK9_9BACI|nr:riboflavin synthase [Psychrobacillus vulpis]TQR20783.1 riboflavin synthase [Psychrobacillus vulpis]
MFTGIVEEMGKVTSINKAPNSMELTIQSKIVLEDVKLGDSIAVNGVCLTVTSFTKNTFTVDVMPETVKATNIKSLQIGTLVNLERAMKFDGRFGGHFVSGHVDGTGVILQTQKRENAVYIDIQISKEISELCIPKGSITIDGISLTIFNITPEKVTVSLIPHTFENTVIGFKNVRDVVNIENDLLGKYVIHQMGKRERKSNLSFSYLSERGF